jgi:DNA-directed RNA polymerase specialized sigma24 family protein
MAAASARPMRGSSATRASDRNGGLAVSPTTRSEQIAAFYRRHADRIRRTVAAVVHASVETIEDACQTAWAFRLRRDDVSVDDRGANWLITVAIRQAWQLALSSRETPVGTFQGVAGGDDDVPEPADRLATDTDEQALSRIEAAERVVDLQALKARERRELYLKALGYSYGEIAQLTGSTYTEVNRRVVEGRARLRTLQAERENDTSVGDRG